MEGDQQRNLEIIEALRKTLPIQITTTDAPDMAVVESIQCKRHFSLGLNSVTVTGKQWSRFDKEVLDCILLNASPESPSPDEAPIFKGTLVNLSRALKSAGIIAKDVNILESLNRLASVRVTVENKFTSSSGNVVRQIAAEGKLLQLTIDKLYADYFILAES